MSSKRFKQLIFVLEGLNAFATGFYFNWIFFYTEKILHFGIKENLGLVALHGFIYTFSAWFGGWFGHRYGGFTALKLGFGLMALALGAGNFLAVPMGQVIVVGLWTFGMCFTWPTLQALVSRGESSTTLPKLAGIYNLVWSGVAALSLFLGGSLTEDKNLGINSIFFIPALIHVFQFGWVFWLERKAATVLAPAAETTRAESVAKVEPHAKPGEQKMFLRLALMANPLAYVAINTAIPLIPEVAKRFNLTASWVGLVCSVWFFVRMGAFLFYWLWPGWHYRFRWLATATLVLGLSFMGILMSSHLWVLVISQVFFGISVGLIYYSSLFYSMDGGAAKSKKGGLHEAMIGFGTLLGAAVGISAKLIWPHLQEVSIWAVASLLFIGFISLLVLKWKTAPKEDDFNHG